MTKDQHQKELLKKIKPGIKPSDFKKPHQNLDEGYESEALSPPLTPLLKPQKATIRDKSPHKNQAVSPNYELTLLTRMEELQAQNQALIAKLAQLENQAKSPAEKPHLLPSPALHVRAHLTLN